LSPPFETDNPEFTMTKTFRQPKNGCLFTMFCNNLAWQRPDSFPNGWTVEDWIDYGGRDLGYPDVYGDVEMILHRLGEGPLN
jgi:hypothetical protein